MAGEMVPAATVVPAPYLQPRACCRRNSPGPGAGVTATGLTRTTGWRERRVHDRESLEGAAMDRVARTGS